MVADDAEPLARNMHGSHPKIELLDRRFTEHIHHVTCAIWHKTSDKDEGKDDSASNCGEDVKDLWRAKRGLSFARCVRSENCFSFIPPLPAEKPVRITQMFVATGQLARSRPNAPDAVLKPVATLRFILSSCNRRSLD